MDWEEDKPDNWWEIKCIDPSSSIVAARQKCPKKVIAANPGAACRAPRLLLGERYERQWCGRGDATFRDFLRRSARKLGHCGRHTAPMQPAMIIRHFGDWATCPSPSSPGFLHAQNIDRGQYIQWRWRSRFRNPKLGYWSTMCNCIPTAKNECAETLEIFFLWINYFPWFHVEVACQEFWVADSRG